MALVEQTLFKIGDQQYAFTVPRNRALEKAPEAPFITAVIWASDDGAAQRASMKAIEEDGLSVSEPPRELLPDSQARTYSELVAILRKMGTVREYATYRIASDGAFVHRVVESGNHSYFFRGRDAKADELPYAIRIGLT